MASQTWITRLGGLAALMGLASSAQASSPPLPRQITITTQNDTRIQYLVPPTEEDLAPSPDEAATAPTTNHVSGRRTRVPSRIEIHYTAANGKTTRANLHGLSTGHLPTCGNANQETIDGVMAPVAVTCTNVDDIAVPFTIDHVEHGMGSHVSIHIPGLFEYQRTVSPEGEDTAFTSFLDGSRCTYKGPTTRPAGSTEPCKLDIRFRFGPATRGD